MATAEQILRAKLSADNLAKLLALDNPKLHRFVAEAIELCQPDSVYVCTDDPADAEYVRTGAIERGEESPLKTPGHTYHFDGPNDVARDRERTKYLLPKGVSLGERINSIDKEVGLAEIMEFFRGSMTGKEMLVCFYCLGPTNSEFAIPCVQITDSFYVAHSENLLYRPGYEEFRRLGRSEKFFRFLHSAGELEGGVSKHVDKRRIYIDLEERIVYSVNTQYAGNTVGLKKLAFRLAIRKAAEEGWLAEHMFLMGVHGPNNRVTYFAGAFPSACGKTSTAMLEGQTIVGDDLAYLRKRDGSVYAANVERGIFGILQDVNAKDDPVIWEALTRPGEIIFTNVLVADGRPYWLGMGDVEIPESGINYQGEWYKGKKDKDGREIPYAHKNARYTIRLEQLKNCDPRLNDPNGVPLRAIIFGGRDSNTWVPVEQAFDWVHGVITKGASLESETTAATLGAEGVRKFDLMSILDFLSMPLGQYLQHYLDFARDLTQPPAIFSVNYFLKDENGRYLNSHLDKKVWILWAELRVNGEVDAIETPTGLIPRYEDLKQLFRTSLGKDYTESEYERQFATRVVQHLAKIDRIEAVYRAEKDVPQVLWETLAAQRQRLEEARRRYGKDVISPFDFA